MTHARRVLNLIQDVATPHNNVLIEQFKNSNEVELRLWYARAANTGLYQWEADLSHEHLSAGIIGTHCNWRFIAGCLKRRQESFMIVGWANWNTRILHLLFFLLRRPYNHWTDLPNPMKDGASLSQQLLRWLAYRLLRYSRSRVFVVGKMTINCFRRWGFPECQLVNLPIFVRVNEDFSSLLASRKKIRSRYCDDINQILISAGSRLVREKGYDLLIRAFALLPSTVRSTTRLVIVGSGEELRNLQNLVLDMNLSANIIFEKWMAIEDFKALIYNSDIFVQPARFDSYGGATLGMALVVPVIGSTGAGAAVDRIVSGENGIIYDVEDLQSLAEAIQRLHESPALRQCMGSAARDTALEWTPERGVSIVLENML